MGSKIESTEKNIVKITLNIPAERFEEGMNHSYNKNKGKISLPGFRKGKAPRALIEKQYGRQVFMDDAIEYIFPEAYNGAIKEHELEPVSRPEIDFIDFDDDGALLLTVITTVKPEVVLGEYKGLTYRDHDITVSDAEVDAEIESAREKNARIVSVTDRPVDDGDTAVIDYEGFIDGFPFNGGKDENHELVIGSHTFIDTFEEQLIGKNIGDELDVSVTFPEDYHSAEFAGKPAVFKVRINEITKKELPELDDDFAQDVSEFNTLDEYKNSVKDRLKNQKEHQKERAVEDELIGKACENAEVDIPDIMVENQINQMLMEFESRLRSQGMDIDMFLQYSGQTPEALRENYRTPAENNIRARLVLSEIAKKEGIAVAEEDINSEVARIADVYGIEEEKMRAVMRDEDIKGLETDLKTQQALKVITESAVAEKLEPSDRIKADASEE